MKMAKYIFTVIRSKTGTPILDNIEDDEEYEAASDGFDEWLDSLEYDELVSEDEEDEE